MHLSILPVSFGASLMLGLCAAVSSGFAQQSATCIEAPACCAVGMPACKHPNVAAPEHAALLPAIASRHRQSRAHGGSLPHDGAVGLANADEPGPLLPISYGL